MQQAIKEMEPAEALSIGDVHSDAEVKVQLLTESADFDALQQEWDQLLDESDQGCFFIRWNWNRIWWRTYAPEHSRLFLITCRDENDRLMGIAPFFWRDRRIANITYIRELQFLGTGIGIKINEYMDIVARRGHEKVVADSIADFLKNSDEWDRLCLWCVPSTSILQSHFQKAMGRDTKVEICDKAQYVDTTGDWATYLKGFSGSARYKIKNRTRTIFEMPGSAFNQVKTSQELDLAMNALVRLHQARWESKGEPGSFRLPHFEEFFKETMRASLADGRLRFWTLTIDGVISAVLVAFIDRGIAHYFQSGFDPAYASNGIGGVMISQCINACFESPEIRVFDFMGGGASYKDQWTSTVWRMIELEAFRPCFRSSAYKTLRSADQNFRAIVRRLLPLEARNNIKKALRIMIGRTDKDS